MTTSTPYKNANLHINTAIPAPSINDSRTLNAENVQKSTHDLRNSRSPNAGDDVYADELFKRYSLMIDPVAQAKSIVSTVDNGRKERLIASHLDDGEGYPQSIEEEIDIYLHDKDGNVYVEKAVVRSRKDRRPGISNDGKVIVSDRPSRQKNAVILQQEETGSPLDIRCRGTSY